MEFLAKCFTDALDSFEFAFGGEFYDVAVEVPHGVGTLPIGADLEWVLALHFQ